MFVTSSLVHFHRIDSPNKLHLTSLGLIECLRRIRILLDDASSVNLPSNAHPYDSWYREKKALKMDLEIVNRGQVDAEVTKRPQSV